MSASLNGTMPDEVLPADCWSKCVDDCDRPSVPNRLGNYEILEQIGRGGMGTVYLARHLMLDQTVALKVLGGSSALESKSVQRFLGEIKAAGSLTHCNLVRATDAGMEHGWPFLVMEYIPGCDVRQLLQSLGPLPVREACEIVRQACLGLDHAHNGEFIHRDIKPSNLIVSRTGEVKILDLGLARLRSRPTDELTKKGFVVGSLDYLAPEQFEPMEEFDVRSDIYAMGCTLYAMLAGAPPFHAIGTDKVIQKLNAHIRMKPTPINHLRKDVPNRLAKIIEKMMAKQPNERYSTAAEVASALRPLADGANMIELVMQCQTHPVGATPIPVRPKAKLTTSKVVVRRWAIALLPIFVALFAACAIAGKTIHFRSTHGKVTINLSDDELASDAAVFIDGNQIRIENIGEPIWLTLGEHAYEFRQGDTIVRGDRFEVRRNGASIVEITVEPIEPNDSVASSRASFSRDSLERILESGASVDLYRGGSIAWSSNDPKGTASLPNDLSECKWWVDFTSCSIDESHISAVADLGNVYRIKIADTNVSDTALEQLQSIRGLTELSLAGSKGFGDTGLHHVCDCRGLVALELAQTNVTNVGLSEISQLRNLARIDLAGTAVDDTGIRFLEPLDALESLILSDSQVTGQCLTVLPRRSLSIIELNGVELSDGQLEALDRFRKLTTLSVRETSVSDEGLTHVGEVVTLQYLYLDKTTVTDIGLPHLSGLHDLVHLQLGQTVVTGTGIESILSGGTHPKLQHIGCEDARVTSQDALRLQRLFPSVRLSL